MGSLIRKIWPSFPIIPLGFDGQWNFGVCPSGNFRCTKQIYGDPNKEPKAFSGAELRPGSTPIDHSIFTEEYACIKIFFDCGKLMFAGGKLLVREQFSTDFTHLKFKGFSDFYNFYLLVFLLFSNSFPQLVVENFYSLKSLKFQGLRLVFSLSIGKVFHSFPQAGAFLEVYFSNSLFFKGFQVFPSISQFAYTCIFSVE